jgi:hypothetical protein
MVVDHFLDMADDHGQLWLRAWRCVNCGSVIEPGMFRRRRTHRGLLTRLEKRLLKRATLHEVVPIGV